MKIAYCGYDFFSACLSALIESGQNVYKVFTFDCDNRFNFNNYIYEICSANSIPVSNTPVSDDIINSLAQEGCDVLITAGYRYKIPDLTNTPIKGINIHPTLLPLGRGVWPVPWTILTQQRKTGITIHKLTSNFDTGDILLRKEFAVDPHENLESLSSKLQMQAVEVLWQLMQDFEEKWQNAKPQEENGSYWSMPSEQDRTIDWKMNVEEIDRIARAFGKFSCYARFDNKDWYVYDLTAWEEPHSKPLGTVVHKTNTEMVIAAADGFVCMRYFAENQKDTS